MTLVADTDSESVIDPPSGVVDPSPTSVTRSPPVAGDAPAAPPHRPWRRRAFTAARLLVTVVVLALLVHRSGVRPILRHLTNADPRWLAFGFGMGLASASVTVLQWHGLLKASGLRRSYRRCLRLELAGDVFDAALPSAIGGDVIRAISVGNTPAERVPGAASVVLRRLCNFPGMVVLLAIGLLTSLDLPYRGRVLPYALAALAGGIGLSVMAASPAFGRLAQLKIFRRGPGLAVAKLLDALHAFRGRRRDLLLAGARGLGFWCVVVASQWGFMRAVGIHVPITYAAVVITTTTAITMLPISLGGYGLREGAFSAFLAVGGMATTAQGIAVGVCLTAQTVALGVIGLPFYLTLRRERRNRSVPDLAVAPAGAS